MPLTSNETVLFYIQAGTWQPPIMQAIVQECPSTYEIKIGIPKNYILPISRCFHENCSSYFILNLIVETSALSCWKFLHFIDFTLNRIYIQKHKTILLELFS